MKWAYYIKYKIRTVAFLAIILVVVLLGNILERNSYSTLDTSMSSIYQDRLMASQYIYGISNALYQKKLLIAEGQGKEMQPALAQHDETIHTLIGKYEKTVLTKEEKVKWASFKENLVRYNHHEKQWLNSTMPEQAEAVMQSGFHATIANLDALSSIQAGEGQHLLEDSHTIVNSRLAFSSFEISLLIILGMFVLVIISATDKRIFPNWQNKALN